LTIALYEDVDDTAATEEGGGINIPGGILIDRTRAKLPSLDDVIVVHKIETLRMKSQYALIFSAVGSVNLP
jgi:hypothetical protein